MWLAGCRRWAVGAVLVIAVVTAACSSAPGDRQIFTESTMPTAEAVKWTGIEDTTGLTIDLVHQEGFQDHLVEVVLRGTGADLDRTMSSAGFTAALRPGLWVQSPTGFDPSKLTEVRSAQDRWSTQLGQPVYRNAVRGRLPSGDEVVFFSAFTT